MLAYAEVEKAAEEFRVRHRVTTVPVDIIPLPGLRREFQVDGFLASDWHVCG